MSLGLDSISEVALSELDVSITAPAAGIAESSADVVRGTAVSWPAAGVADTSPSVSYSAVYSVPGAGVADSSPAVVSSIAISFPAAGSASSNGLALFNLVASAAGSASSESHASVVALVTFTDPNRLFTAENERRFFVVGDDGRSFDVPARDRMVA